jgi:hypothetical protein
MENTRTRSLSVDNSEGREREREKGNGVEEKEQNRKGGQPTIGKKCSSRKKRETKSSGNVCRCRICTKNAHTAAIFIYSPFLNFRTRARSFVCMRSRYETSRMRKRTDAQRYVVVEITKKGKDKEFTIINRSE